MTATRAGGRDLQLCDIGRPKSSVFHIYSPLYVCDMWCITCLAMVTKGEFGVISLLMYDRIFSEMHNEITLKPFFRIIYLFHLFVSCVKISETRSLDRFQQTLFTQETKVLVLRFSACVLWFF